jgi:N-acetylmuramoyl-L-alanine amidase
LKRLLLWLGTGSLILGIGILSLLLWTNHSAAEPLPTCPPGWTIVLDPGHGGIDGGTNLPGVLEKSIVLDIALRTRVYLERYHIPVVLTREADVDLGGETISGRLARDLNYRVRVANHCQTALLVSLHVNSAHNATEKGMIVFYQPSRPSRDAAFQFEDVLRRSGLHDRLERPIPRNDFAVLRGSKSPALLVEMGFLTNEQDRHKLIDPAYREQVAQGLSAACASIYHQWVK